MSTSTFPLIHLNGSDGERLLKDAQTSLYAVNQAIEAMHAGQPNARDYYPRGLDAYSQARREYEGHLGALRGVREYLSELSESIEGQLADRKAQRAGR